MLVGCFFCPWRGRSEPSSHTRLIGSAEPLINKPPAEGGPMDQYGQGRVDCQGILLLHETV